MYELPDLGGWGMTTVVGLYFIFPGICTLSLTADSLVSSLWLSLGPHLGLLPHHHLNHHCQICLPAYIHQQERGGGNLTHRSGVKEPSVCKQRKPNTENVPTVHGCGKEHQQMFARLPNN
ncbi:hypothetical protein STEG23_011049, partial [Scotinomys teguina]